MKNERTPGPILKCLGCSRELLTDQDMHEIDVRGISYGPLCAACARSAEGMPFAQWLDEMWQRQRPN